MNCRDRVKPPLYVDRIDYIIDTQILKTPNILLFNWLGLDNGIKPDINTLKKERGEIF